MVIAHLQEEAAEADAAAAKAAAASSSSAPPPPPSSSSAAASYALHYHRLVDMGHLLLSFFRRFGKIFDYERQAVRVSKGGVRPKPAAWVLPDKPRYLLSVEDPQEQGKDIGSGTFNVMAVRECFSRAADALSAVLEREQRAANVRESGIFARCGAGSGATTVETTAAAFSTDPVATEAAWRSVQAEGSNRSLPPLPAAASGSLQTLRPGPSLLRSILDVDSIANGRRVTRAGGDGRGGGGGNAFGGGGRGGSGSTSLPQLFPSSSAKRGKSPRGGGAAAAALTPSKHHPEMHRHVAHLVPASKAPEGRRVGKFAARKAARDNCGGCSGGSRGPPRSAPLSISALVYQHQQQTQDWNHISHDGVGVGGGGGGGGSSGRGGRGGRGGGGRGGRGGGGRSSSSSSWQHNGSSSTGGMKKARWRSNR